MRTGKFYAAGISVETGALLLALLDEKGKSFSRSALPLNKKDDLVPAINSVLHELLDKHKNKIAAVGISFPGVSGTNKECIAPLSEFPECSSRNIALELSVFLRDSIPVIVERNATCALNFFKAGRTATENCLIVSLRRGVSAAIMLDGKIVHGLCGMIGNMGHIKIADPAKAVIPCSCGQTGCIGTVAGGTAWQRRWEIISTKNKKLPNDFKLAVSKGVPQAIKTLENGIEAIFTPILSFISLFRPEFLIFDMDLPHSSGLIFVTEIRKIFEHERIANPPSIEFFFDDDFAEATGAALFALDAINKETLMERMKEKRGRTHET